VDRIPPMGPNRRAQDRERAAARAAAEAKRAEAERKAIAEAERIVAIWNARQAGGRTLWFCPTIGAAIAAGLAWLSFSCPRASNSRSIRARRFVGVSSLRFDWNRCDVERHALDRLFIWCCHERTGQPSYRLDRRACVHTLGAASSTVWELFGSFGKGNAVLDTDFGRRKADCSG
jgi:hypothetical protein